jgi:hypothetical protein
MVELEAPSSDDLWYVRACLDSYFTSHYYPTVAKEPPFDPSDGGAPPDMWSAPVDSEGWVEWRMLPTRVRPHDVAALEAEFAVKFPPLFRAYLQSYSHLFDQVLCAGASICLPSLPSDAPLNDIRFTLAAWRPLVKAQLLPFGTYEDGWGPLCFDRGAESPDPPIVWLEHELLASLDPPISREQLQPLFQPVFSSFRDLLAKLGS